MNRLILLLCFVLALSQAMGQAPNNNYKTGPINIPLLKTPESKSFEHYGNIPVSEVTGTANIAIPVYTLKSHFLEVPITLSYNATGIKVSQEASWVGLGFDLIAGGRITVETKGCPDNLGTSLFSSTGLKYGMKKLFDRLGNSRNVSILTYASTCTHCDTSITHNIPDDWASINAMATFGLGEPDIYHANFMGHSCSFYFDKITDSLRWLGEKTLFDINLNKDPYGRITDWTLTDNMGNVYSFNERENTTMAMPPAGPFTNPTSTTAWLLTRVVNPAKDTINFYYTNYGLSRPITPLYTALTFLEGERSLDMTDPNPNQVSLEPKYLTRIETRHAAVDFTVGNREDIMSSGSKRLNEIKVIDRQTNKVVKHVTFDYGYFNSSLSTCYSNAPDSLKKNLQLRLKLNTLSLDDTASHIPPYKFFYNLPTSMPVKRSFSIDHWGYLNNSNNGKYMTDPCSPKNLVPNTGVGTAVNEPAMNGYAYSREMDSTYISCLTLDSIVYPTGGSTKLIYEPHRTTYIDGGGIRVKTIKSYALSRLLGSVDYTYAAGTYMGCISYHTATYVLSACTQEGQPGGDQEKDIMSSEGALNDNNMLVAYSAITQTQRDEKGRTNGSLVKTFNVPNPRYTMGGYGFDVLPAHWPTTYNNSPDYLFPTHSSHPPTPVCHLDGKLLSEQYYDDQNKLIKRVDYYYSQADYSENFYSIKATDNRIGGSDAPQNCDGGGQEFTDHGERRYTVFVSPAKSYFTLTDGVVENTSQGPNTFTNKRVYGYNKHYQPEYETVYNSDGSQTITHTITSAEADLPTYSLATGGEAELLSGMKAAHIYDLPIEKTTMKRQPAGDSLVVQSDLMIYKGVLPLKVFQLETPAPLVFRTEFKPLTYAYSSNTGIPPASGYDLLKDEHYHLSTTADYSPLGQIKTLHRPDGNTAYIFDELYDNVLARCLNADSSQIAFTSFETQAWGGWSYDVSGIVADASAPTGKKVYSLSTGALSSNVPDGPAYIVSYWSKSGPQTVSGGGSAATGATFGGWTYHEHKVDHPTAGAISISGSGLIDEARLYPSASLMTSYTYEPLVGIIGQCDPASHVLYYEYDDAGRLLRLRDQNRNILKQFEYKFNSLFSFPYGNTIKISTATRSCPSGYASYVPYPYTVTANAYGSFVSQEDADEKAQADVDAHGQAWANEQGICQPYYSFVACCGWGSPGVTFTLGNTGAVSFSLVLINNTGVAYGQSGTLSGSLFLPSTNRSVIITSGGKTYTLEFQTSGVVNIYGPSFTGSLQLSGSYQL